LKTKRRAAFLFSGRVSGFNDTYKDIQNKILKDSNIGVADFFLSSDDAINTATDIVPFKLIDLNDQFIPYYRVF